jgi:GntR family transcriptional regulator
MTDVSRIDSTWAARSHESLPMQLAKSLRTRIRAGEWGADGWMPTEAEICREYEVSRATTREAIRLLESQGLAESRHGIGTRVIKRNGMVHAGLQELKSITETIAEIGKEPRMEFRLKLLRPAEEQDRSDFDVAVGTPVLQLRRLLRADGDAVAFLDDVLPIWALGDRFKVDDLTGSVFQFLRERRHLRPRRAVAEVYPRRELPAPWQDDEALSELPPDTMFLLLDQLQYDDENRPFMRTRAHFVDGRFSFVVLRIA